MDKNKVKLLLLVAGAGFAVLGIILFVCGIIYDKSGFAKFLFFAASILVLALSAELIYLRLMTRDTKPNYFLFKPIINSNISPEKLTFEMIDEKMNKYLSTFADSEGKIWTDRVLEIKGAMIDPAFFPAVSYKLLFDLAKFDNEAGWKCFVGATPATVELIARGVAKNGDNALAGALVQLKSANPVNIKQTRDYLVGNKKYIQKKLYRYVCDNIDRF